MVSIMRAWKSADGARGLAAALSLAMLFVSNAGAGLKVAEVNARLTPGALALTGQLDIELPPRVEQALSKGIELPLRIELRLKRARRFLWDPTVAAWTLERRLRYHALSNQYMVDIVGGGAGSGGEAAAAPLVESYGSLLHALKALGHLDLQLALPPPAAPAQAHRVELRASLDIEALPAPLRPVAYTSSAWHLDSGWTTWPVTH